MTHPRYLADLSLISIILDIPANRFVVEFTEIMLYAIDYILCTAAEGGQNHYRCYGGQTSLCAHDGEPPIHRTVEFSGKNWSRNYVITLECRHLLV